MCLRTSPSSDWNRGLYNKKVLWKHISFVFIFTEGEMWFWYVLCAQILFIAMVCLAIKRVDREHYNAEMGIPSIHWNRDRKTMYYCMYVCSMHELVEYSSSYLQCRRISSIYTTTPSKTCFYFKIGNNLNLQRNKRKVIYMTSKNNTF
jgi:hypothetical protein